MSRQIQVRSLFDMHELMKTLDKPSEVYVPWGVFATVSDRMAQNWKGQDEISEYIWFEGAKLRPPRPNEGKSVDLSDAEELE